MLHVFFLAPFLAVAMTAAELHHAVKDNFHAGLQFEVRGTVTAELFDFNYIIRDETGYCHIRCTSKMPAKVGDIIKAKGRLGLERNGGHLAYANTIDVEGRDAVTEPVDVESGQICTESMRYRLVRVPGIVVDAMRDEIDLRWSYLTLRGNQDTFLVAMPLKYSDEAFGRLVGAKVSVTGVVCGPSFDGVRKLLDWHVASRGLEDIKVVESAEENPSAIPLIESLGDVGAIAVTRMNRRRAEGLVLAVWKNRFALVRQDDGRLVRIGVKGDALPSCGDRIVAVGFPETDLFNINLSRATFRKVDIAPAPPEKPLDVTVEDLTSGPYGKNQMQMQYYGRTVKIGGRILDTARRSGRGIVFTLTCGGELVQVDMSASGGAKVEPGSGVEVVGVVVMNTGAWRPTDVVPRIDGFTIVPRSTDDVRVTSKKPWWTPERLSMVIGVLFALLIAILTWNRILGHLVKRYGRSLYRAEISKVESELRVDERTRLAAELHDSIAQTLTGVSFHIDAAEKMLRDDPKATATFLDVARRTLLSCREDLRRCLWDLRSLALEDPDFAGAVAKTIAPHSEGVSVSVDLNVRRSQLSDTTAHNMLCIIRELCVNAIRHGKASHLRIEGEQLEDRLRFSVKDDGIGFDPANRAGPSKGHFGLQGVKERLKRLHGTFKIDSTPGKGTTVTMEIWK